MEESVRMENNFNGTPGQQAPQTPPANGQTAPPGAQHAQGYAQNPQNQPGAQDPQANAPYTPGQAQNPQPPYTAPNAPRPPYGQQPPFGANPQAYRQGQPQNPHPPYSAAPNAQQPYYGQPQRPYYPPYAQQPTRAYMSPEKQRDHAGIRSISNATGLAIIGFTASSFIVSVILSLIPGFFDAYDNSPLLYICANALLSVVALGVPFFCAYCFMRKKRLIGDLNLGTPVHGSMTVLLIFAALMCCMVGNYATNFLSTFVEAVFGIQFVAPSDDFTITGLPAFLLRIAQTAMLPALIEEFAVRGTVLQPLRRYGDKFALLMSAFVFALMHGNMVQIPFAFIAGLAIGYAVIATGSLWTGVIIHFCNNLIAVCSEAAYDLLPEETAALITLGLMALVFIAGLVCAIVYFKKYARVPLGKRRTELDSREKNRAFLCSAPMIIAIILLVLETIQYVKI